MKPIRNVLVYGANGVQGGAIARQLRAEGFDVCACVRNDAQLRAANAQLRVADLDRPDSLRRASDGADAVVLTLPLEWNPQVVLRWARAAAEAARAAGVQLLVLNTSARVPAEASGAPSLEQKREVERTVREFGPPCIALRPPLFLENLLAPWIAGVVAKDRVLPYPLHDRMRVSWLAVEDLGAYVGAALRRPELAGSAFDIGGPELLDGPGLAGQIGSAIDALVRYVAVAPAEIGRQLAPLFGEDVAQGIARHYAWLAERPEAALFQGTSDALASELRRTPLSAASWAQRHSAAFRG